MWLELLHGNAHGAHCGLYSSTARMSAHDRHLILLSGNTLRYVLKGEIKLLQVLVCFDWTFYSFWCIELSRGTSTSGSLHSQAATRETRIPIRAALLHNRVSYICCFVQLECLYSVACIIFPKMVNAE